MTENTNPTTQPIPFAGRQGLYARMQQHIIDPPDRFALLYTGHDGIGKSALLTQFSTIFDDSLLGIYIALETAPLADENAWLQYLIDAINTMLEAHNFSLSRVPTVTSDSELPLRQWLNEVYLPEVFRIIRPQRRLVWLFDNAEHFLVHPAINHCQLLADWMKAHHQMAIVLTLNTRHEAKIADLAPLVKPSSEERLHLLTLEDSANIIRAWAPGAEDSLIADVFQATGGHPQLLQFFGQELAKVWNQSSPDDAYKHASKRVNRLSDKLFLETWGLLDHNQRLVLTALTSLIYDDPLRDVTSKQIENWLIETDYPVDLVGIQAALRGLDYRDIVRNQPHKIVLLARLHQQWLLEHARLESDLPSAPRSQAIPVRVILAIIGIVIVVLLLLVLLPPPTISPLPNATVTLAQ